LLVVVLGVVGWLLLCEDNIAPHRPGILWVSISSWLYRSCRHHCRPKGNIPSFHCRVFCWLLLAIDWWGARQLSSLLFLLLLLLFFCYSSCQIIGSRGAKGTDETSTDRNGILKQNTTADIFVVYSS
jgi:hypothetical protein